MGMKVSVILSPSLVILSGAKNPCSCLNLSSWALRLSFWAKRRIPAVAWTCHPERSEGSLQLLV